MKPRSECRAGGSSSASFADPLIYLLLAAVVVSLVAWILEGRGGPFDAFVIAAIVVANAVFGYAQEARPEQAVVALQRMAAAMALADPVETQ